MNLLALAVGSAVPVQPTNFVLHGIVTPLGTTTNTADLRWTNADSNSWEIWEYLGSSADTSPTAGSVIAATYDGVIFPYRNRYLVAHAKGSVFTYWVRFIGDVGEYGPYSAPLAVDFSDP